MTKKELIEKLEEILSCSLTLEPFKEPVITNCGHVFEKADVSEWASKKNTCPCCMQPIKPPFIDIFGYRHLIDVLEQAKKSRR